MRQQDNNIQHKLSLALKYHKENNFVSAEKIYKEVLEKSPSHLGGIFNLATLYAQKKNFGLAKDLFLKAYNIKPQDPNINLNLGNIFFETGDFEKALKYFENLTNIHKNFATAHFNKGIVLNNLKKYEKANESFKRVIEIEPSNLASYNIISKNLIEISKANEALFYLKKSLEIDSNNNISIKILTELLGSLKISVIDEKNKKDLEYLFIFLYNKNSINHNQLFNNAKLFIFNENELDEIRNIIKNNTSLIQNQIFNKIYKNKLFLLILQKSLLRDKFLETVLIKIRKEIIFYKDNFEESDPDLLNFIISIAEQCYLNEYINFQTDEEIKIVNKLLNKIENDKYLNELEISILACYMPLYNSKNISQKLLDYHSQNYLFDDLINLQVREPNKENNLMKTINSIEKIKNLVSKKVQAQYEENPYPRWRYLSMGIKSNFLNILTSNIKPNTVNSEYKFINPNVLIAGCGTGQQLENIVCYENSNILAVDLSLTSLAYAKRKIQELNFKNIEFLKGDILDLPRMNKKFDIIECVGVLHHMQNPNMGLRALLDVLEPHGVLKLGLYSEIARKHIIEARNFIKKKNLSSHVMDIRNCRELIKKNKNIKSLNKITYNYDFYSTSSLRDLLFHVQEQRFTLNKISKMLNVFNLEFLGFSNKEIKKKYSNFFPDDVKNTNIQNWHEFEIQNPDTFISMYQFWVRRK